jgi:predicted nucleic acid-binding protein
MSERYLIDTDVLVAGEHTPEIVAGWIESKHDVATCDVVRAEFLVGVHAPSQAATREKARRYYEEHIAVLPSLPIEKADYDQAGRLIGEAIRHGKARPSLGDGLIAACALREGRIVATKNVTNFKAMGCDPEDPFKS